MAVLKTPEHLQYQTSDEWLLIEGDVGTIGLSDYAQDQLNDLVFVELPEVGQKFKKGQLFGTVESVKAAGELLMPVDGEVTEVNTRLEEKPEEINVDPYGTGWIIKIKVTGVPEGLMTAAEYAAYCETR
ncbi:MAG: glycine cleavage system protein GcvH [Phototrophicaceae bacterium]|jgi:glycine cleavage system H protein